MTLLGSFEKFSPIITDNIQIGIYNNKVVPIFNYNGKHKKITSNMIMDKSDKLIEVVEEVLYGTFLSGKLDYKYIVTRSKGTSSKEIDTLNLTKVSIIFEENNILYVWTPTFEEILTMLSFYPDNEKQTLSIVKAINDKLGETTDFNVYDIITEHAGGLGEILNYTELVLNEKMNIRIQTVGLYSLLKQIMISEDIRYKGTGQLGRYLIQLAIFDYLKNGETIQAIKKKYKLN